MVCPRTHLTGQRYGEAVAIEELPGAEGETYKAFVLLPRAKDGRIEVSFADDSMNRVSGLSLHDSANSSRCNCHGASQPSGQATPIFSGEAGCAAERVCSARCWLWSG